MIDLRSLRKDFPMLAKSMHGKPLIYFDTAATAQKPQAVINAICDFYQNKYGTVHRAVYELAVHSTQAYQETRRKVQAFLKAAHAEEIIYTRGTTEAINMVAYCFGKAFIKPGDEILISEMEHHSNIVPWQILCEDRGAVLKVVPMNDEGELLIKDFIELLSSRTKLVAMTYISNALGTINPVKEIVQLAHAAGAKVLIDAAQAAPHLPLDVQALGVDFLVFSGHKVYGPTGIGILYAKAELLEMMPPYQGGGDMIDTVTFAKSTYNAIPLKFEAGTPMIAEVIGLGVAIDYLQSIGLGSIQQWEHMLLEEATRKMLEIPGLRILGTAKKKGAIITFAVDGVHALDIGTMLDLKGIAIRTGHHCAQPAIRHFQVDGAARVSFGLYNTPEEISGFVLALKDVIRKFK